MQEEKEGKDVQTNEAPLPQPKKKEAVVLVQTEIPESLTKQVDRLRKSADPKNPVTRQAIVEWGFREWLRRLQKKE